MSKVIHVMIRVLQEQRSIDFYKTALNLSVADRYEFAGPNNDGYTLVYLRNAENDFEVELTINRNRTAPYGHGDGYGHIAVAVDDLAEKHAQLSAAKIVASPIKELFRDGTLMARFFFITDPDGYKIEVLQRHGRYR
jgi:lactoylglutathione lyase